MINKITINFSGVKNIGGLESLKDYPYIGVENKCAFDASKVEVKVEDCETYHFKNEDDLVKLLYKQGPLSVGT